MATIPSPTVGSWSAPRRGRPDPADAPVGRALDDPFDHFADAAERVLARGAPGRGAVGQQRRAVGVPNPVGGPERSGVPTLVRERRRPAREAPLGRRPPSAGGYGNRPHAGSVRSGLPEPLAGLAGDVGPAEADVLERRLAERQQRATLAPPLEPALDQPEAGQQRPARRARAGDGPREGVTGKGDHGGLRRWTIASTHKMAP